MRIAIMQPYFLPYIGYFQLMAAVDRLVILDDVNFINRGWINRNRIPSGNGTAWLTLPLSQATQNRLICDIEILPDNGWKRTMERTVALTYAKAREADQILPMFCGWLALAAGKLPAFLAGSLRDIAKLTGIGVDIVHSSVQHPRGGLHGADRILEICRREGAGMYVNLPGGRALYDKAIFARAGIDLRFVEPDFPAMTLVHRGTEGPVLSILDLMMQNSPDALARAMRQFNLSVS